MAKKSNKTEHVMKLITKDEGDGDSVGVDFDVDTEFAEASTKEINYKTKLKIEIEPEIELKEGKTYQGSQGSMENENASLENEEPSEKTLNPELEEAIRKEEWEKAFEEARETVKEEVMEEALEIAREQAKEEEERKTRRILMESALLDKNDHLINLAEILTKELMPSVMEKMDVCHCVECTRDVLALTLNSLPPKYITSDEGKQYTQLDVYKKQYELDVMAAITKACVKVKSTPRHEG